jgi:hypothetical protein
MTQATRPAGGNRLPSVPIQAGLSMSFLTMHPTIFRLMFLLFSAYLAAVRPSGRSC